MITSAHILPKSGFSKSAKQSIIFFSVIPLIVAVLVAVFSSYRIDDFRTNQECIAISVVNTVAQETSRLIRENRRLLTIFVDNERPNIKNLIADPTNDDYKKIIEASIKIYFPEYFTFTVVNQFGDPIIADFDGYIGDICLADIKAFSDTQSQAIQVHPNPSIYHTGSARPAAWVTPEKTRLNAGDTSGQIYVI